MKRRTKFLLKRRFYRIERQLYNERHQKSIGSISKDEYWGKQAEKLDWNTPFQSVYNSKSDVHFPEYFLGGKLNMCYNAVDRHLNNGFRPALIYESQALNTKEVISVAKLYENVCKLAQKMKDIGVTKGDKIVIYMPMIPEAVYAMLAAARLGAPHVCVFGGFAAKELATRITDSQPKLIISASHGFEPNRSINFELILAEALEIANYSPKAVFLKDRREHLLEKDEKKPEAKLNCEVFCTNHILEQPMMKEKVPCEPVDSSHPLYILHTSGTTGLPKGVVRDTGGHAVSLVHAMTEYMDCAHLDTDEVYFSAADIGWVVGHSFLVYGPLLNGTTTILYEGKPTPSSYNYLKRDHNTSKNLWSVIADNRVTKAFVAPTTLRAIRAQDPNLTGFREEIKQHLSTIFVAGERGDPDTIQFYSENLKLPIIDNYWQTETGSPIIGFQDIKIGTKYGTCGLPLPGFDVEIQKEGELTLKLPLPPGCLTTIHNNSERYVSEYLSTFPGYYMTGDIANVDEDGYISVLSRTTDIINTAGHRLSTGGLEEVLLAHDSVLECAVVGKTDELKGHVPFAFIVVDNNNSTLIPELHSLVRESIGAIAALGGVAVVEALPKTRSGKTLRGTLKSILNKEQYNVPATIENIDVLSNIEAKVNNI